jgi:hypothetical protein
LPEALRQRIDATTDIDRLKTAARQVLHIAKIEDLQL